MVEYGVENGLDAWRRLRNHYLSLAGDLQQILIRELHALQPVTKAHLDIIFNQAERVTELYIKVARPEGRDLREMGKGSCIKKIA